MMQKDANQIHTSPFISLSIHFMQMRLLIQRDSQGWNNHNSAFSKTQNVNPF